MSDKPIIPTRVFPAGVSLPPPPASPVPPGWWSPPAAPPAPPMPPAPRFAPPAPRPPDPGPLDIHVTVDVVLPGTAPEPTPSWWQRLRIRWVYNAGCLVFALPLSQPWRTALAYVRDEQSLIGAWTLAAVPLVVVGMIDNARRVEAEHSLPELWAPKVKAALMRVVLWALVIGTITALPVETVVYLLTGVRP